MYAQKFGKICLNGRRDQGEMSDFLGCHASCYSQTEVRTMRGRSLCVVGLVLLLHVLYSSLLWMSAIKSWIFLGVMSFLLQRWEHRERTSRTNSSSGLLCLVIPCLSAHTIISSFNQRFLPLSSKWVWCLSVLCLPQRSAYICRYARKAWCVQANYVCTILGNVY